MAQNNNGNTPKNPPIPLNVVDNNDVEEFGEDTFIVIGEAGEDVAFEVCEDVDIALGVRDAMIEDGFKVKVYQATEIEIVDEESPVPGASR
jgi:hypothetical protein